MINVLFVTADQWRGDCLCGRRPPGRADARTSTASPPSGVSFRRHFAQAAPCGPSRAVALHRHVPVNHRSVLNGSPARRPPHERRPRGPRRSATSRRCSATPTSASTPAPSPPTIRASAPTRACSPASTRSATCPRAIPQAWLDWLRPSGLRRARRLARRSSTSPPTGTQWRTQYDAEHSQTVFLTERVARLRRTDKRRHAVVRAPLLPAAAPAVPRARALRHDVRPRVGARPRCARASRAEEGAQHPLLGVMIDHPFVKSPDDRQEQRELQATYYGMIAEVDDQLGRIFDWLDETGLADKHARRAHVGSRRDCSATTGSCRSSGWFDQRSTCRSSSATRVRSSTRHAARRSTRSPSTSTCTPTICELLDTDVPLQCDGRPLTPFLDGATPDRLAHARCTHELDFRDPDSRCSSRRVRRHPRGVRVRGAPRRPRQVRAVLGPPRVPADLLRPRQRSRAAREPSPPTPRTRRRCSTTRSACSPGA